MPARIDIVLSAEGSAAVAKIFQDLADKGDEFAKNLVRGSRGANDALNSLGGTAKRVFEIFTGFTLGNIAVQIADMARRSVTELTRMGLENQRVEASFTRMANAVGVSADALVASLKSASNGIVDTNNIMLASSKALAQGLNADQLTRVMETARAQATLAGTTVSEAFNQIAESVTNLQVKQLRSFGIVIDLQKAYDDYARSLGTTAAALNEVGQRAAILQKIDEQTRKNRVALTEGERTNAQEIERAKATWSDFFSTVAGGFATVYAGSVKWGARFLEQVQIEKDRLDELGVRWNNYLARTATILAPQTRTSPADMRALRDIGDDATNLSQSLGAVASDGIDKVKHAAVLAEQALVKVNAAMQALAVSSAQETIRAEEFAAAIGVQIAKLQALGSTAPEVQSRIAALQIQMVGLQKAAETAATAARNAVIAASTGELVQGAQDVVDALYNEQKAAAALSDQFRVIERSFALFGGEQARLTAIITTATAAVNALPTGFSETDKVVVALTEKIKAAKIALAEFNATAALIASTAMELKDMADLPEVQTLTKDVVAANRELMALKATTDLDAESLRRFGVSFDLLDKETQDALLSLRAFRQETQAIGGANQFEATLAGIRREADLMGRDFDALSANANAFKQRILELQAIRNPTGAILTEIDQLKAQFADTRDMLAWRDTFQGVFDSIAGSVNTLVQGVLLGTQTMAQAWDKLWKSILLGLLNSGIQKAIKTVGDWLWDALSGAGRGSGGGMGGVARAVGSLFGGGGGAQFAPGTDPRPFIPAAGGGVGGVYGALQSVPGYLEPGTLSTIGSTVGNIWSVVSGTGGGALGPATTGIGAFDVLAAGGSISDAASTLSASMQAASGLSVAVAGVAAAYAVFDNIMTGVNGNMKEFGLRLGLGVAGGIVGGIFGGPLGAFMGIALGDFVGKMLSKLFGFEASLGNYVEKRMAAASEVNIARETLGGVYRGSLDVGTPEAIQRALATGQGGPGGQSVRTELVLPASLAADLGLVGQQVGHMLVTQWATVNQEQFGKILDLFAAQPDLMQNIRGSGDVPYLSGEDAAQVAVSVKESAIALLTAFQALRDVNNELNALSQGITEALDVVLPEDMAATFAEKVIQPFKEGMITALTSGGKTEEVEKRLTALQAKLQAQTAAWADFGEAMMKGIDIEEALAGVRDLAPKFRAAIQPQYDAIQSHLEHGNTRLAATQTANAERLMTLWAAFGEQMAKGLALEEGLAGIGDLGAKFTSVIEPQYAAIEAALIAGNTRVALTLGKAVDRQLALWAAFGASMEQRINVDEALQGVAGLGDRFRAVMDPQFKAIEAALIAGNTTLATTLGKTIDKQLALWGAFGQSVEQAINVNDALGGIAGLGAKFQAAMAPQFAAIEAALIAGDTTLAATLGKTVDKQVAAWGAFGPAVAQAMDVDTALAGLSGLGEQFRTMMQPEYDAILAALLAGNTALAKTLTADFQQKVAALASIGQTFQSVHAEIINLQTDAVKAARAMMGVREQLGRTQDLAKTAFDAAIASGDVEQIAKTSAAYHAAVQASLGTELKIAQLLEGALAFMLAGAAALVQVGLTIARLEITGSGTISTITTLVTALSEMARTASTSTERVWAVQQGIQALIAIMPDLISAFADVGADADPGQITDAIVAGASLFLPALQAVIDAATGGEKLGLLQQQAQIFQDLAAAAIAGVQQWAQQARDAARDAAQVQRDALAAIRDAQLADIDAQIEAITEQAQLAQDARRAQIDGLREAIAKAREWQSAIESMGKFIAQLRQGPLGPGNPADKLRMSQDAFAKALAAYQANPTAQGLGDLQALAQSVLSLAEPILSKPSPAFQTLSANMIRQLEAAQALADQQTEDADLLQQQLDALLALDKALADATDRQIKVLRTERAQIQKSFEARTQAIQEGLTGQIAAIDAKAAAEIEAINALLKPALEANATAQAAVVGAQKKSLTDVVAALTSTAYGAGIADIAVYAAGRQDVAIGHLFGILTAVNSLIPGNATGLERVTEGLYHLHDDEMVLPKRMADQIRSAQDGAGLRQNWVGGLGSHEEAWAEKVHYRRDGTAIYAPGYGPGAPIYGKWGPTAGKIVGYQVVRLGTDATMPPPPTTMPPPPVVPPPPPVVPPPPPPPEPPPWTGPPWLNRQSTVPQTEFQRTAGGVGTLGTAGGGVGTLALTVVVNADGKEIGRAVEKILLPVVRQDARTGEIHHTIVMTPGRKA